LAAQQVPPRSAALHIWHTGFANQGLKINREKRETSEKKDFLAYFAASVLL
jgi:hypothetical protein